MLKDYMDFDNQKLDESKKNKQISNMIETLKEFKLKFGNNSKQSIQIKSVEDMNNKPITK